MLKLAVNKVAEFEVEDCFNITNRGTVLAGKTLSGKLNGGNIFELATDEITLVYEIGSVEFMFSISTRISKPALLMRFENNPELIHLKFAVGKTIHIFST